MSNTRDPAVPEWSWRKAEWVARNFVCDRPDGLRLSVVLGGRDGGFDESTWCWFVYDLSQKDMPVLASGRAPAVTLEEAQALAGECADRRSGRICSRCGLTETEIAQASDGYCDGPLPHPAGPEQSSQHHIGTQQRGGS